jgi:hypothetical protein
MITQHKPAKPVDLLPWPLFAMQCARDLCGLGIIMACIMLACFAMGA